MSLYFIWWASKTFFKSRNYWTKMDGRKTIYSGVLHLLLKFSLAFTFYKHKSRGPDQKKKKRITSILDGEMHPVGSFSLPFICLQIAFNHKVGIFHTWYSTWTQIGKSIVSHKFVVVRYKSGHHPECQLQGNRDGVYFFLICFPGISTVLIMW